MKKRVVVALGTPGTWNNIAGTVRGSEKISESNCRSHPGRISGSYYTQ